MAIAIWNDEVLAESDDIVYLEGNAYFPRASLRQDLFEESAHRSICPWKGSANYLHVVVNGKRNEDAAWYYPDPSVLARKITDRVAFWQGVEIQDSRRRLSAGTEPEEKTSIRGETDEWHGYLSSSRKHEPRL